MIWKLVKNVNQYVRFVHFDQISYFWAASYLRDCQQLFKTKQISHLSFTICAVKRYMYTSKFGASPKCSLVDNID